MYILVHVYVRPLMQILGFLEYFLWFLSERVGKIAFR